MINSRSKYKSLIRCKRYEYDKQRTKKLESVRLKNAKEYWKMLKGLSCPKKSRILMHHVLLIILRPLIIPTQYFFQPEDYILDFSERYMKGELQIMFEELNIEISNHELLKASKELSLGKAGGTYFVLNEFFKYGIDILIYYFGRLFNVVFNKGYFPEI